MGVDQYHNQYQDYELDHDHDSTLHIHSSPPTYNKVKLEDLVTSSTNITPGRVDQDYDPDQDNDHDNNYDHDKVVFTYIH